jgi:TonB family protein
MMLIRRGRALCYGVAMTIALAAAPPPAAGQAAPLTVERLKALKPTSNDPAGDSFIGQSQELRALVDAFVADNSLVSPMLLYMASNTAIRQGQVEQAGFLLYAAQIRRAFDFDRYNVSQRADGNNAATYLGFLNELTGMIVNPALMREPARFAAVIARLEKWDVVPSADAYYPEFEEAKGFKLPREKWAATGAEIKEDFLTKFGRRTAKLLADPEYAEAMRFVQDANTGKIEMNAKVRARMQASLKKMDDLEARLFPGEKRQTPEVPDVDLADAPATPAAAVAPVAPAEPERPAHAFDEMPLRVGGSVPEPKKTKHVEPEFRPGTSGAIILELTIDARGKVSDVNVLRNMPLLEEAAVRAVRQWEFEPVLVNGKPVAVLMTVSVRTPLPN